MGGHEVLSPVSFPTFGLLLYYNTQANTRPPRVHSGAQAHPRARAHVRAQAHPRARAHTSTHPRGVHMVGGAPGGRTG